jgi:hypothetical protein
VPLYCKKHLDLRDRLCHSEKWPSLFYCCVSLLLIRQTQVPVRDDFILNGFYFFCFRSFFHRTNPPFRTYVSILLYFIMNLLIRDNRYRGKNFIFSETNPSLSHPISKIRCFATCMFLSFFLRYPE